MVVAATADDQGLAPPHRHQAHPGGVLTAARLVQIGEFADVVDFQIRCSLADLTAPGEEPMNQLVAFGAGHDRLLVGEHGRADSFERDPAKAGNQRSAAPVAFDHDLKHRLTPGARAVVVL